MNWMIEKEDGDAIAEFSDQMLAHAFARAMSWDFPIYVYPRLRLIGSGVRWDCGMCSDPKFETEARNFRNE